MRTPQPYSTNYHLGNSEHLEEDFKVWLRCVPELRAFSSVDQVLSSLRAAACSRRPDRLLSIVCELADLDDRSNLGEVLLVDAFAGELDRVAKGMDLLNKNEPDHRIDVEEVLAMVVHESVLLGEQQSGRVLMSRTWAASFRRVSHRPGSALFGEVTALCARAVLVVREHLALYRSRGLVDRIAGRLSPPDEAAQVRTDAAATGVNVGDLAAERGLSPLVVGRQVRELDLVVPEQERRRMVLAASLWAVHDFVELREDFLEDEDEDGAEDEDGSEDGDGSEDEDEDEDEEGRP